MSIKSDLINNFGISMVKSLEPPHDSKLDKTGR